jgi:nucleoid-associated protein YgaU/two-component SAPR family response regulator
VRLKAEYGAPDARRERVRLATFIALMLVAGFVLRAVAGPPTLPNHLPSLVQVRDVLGGAVIPLDTLAAVLAALAWLLWLWVTVSLALELLLVAAEAAAHGTAWVRALRRVADRLSMPVARRAVAAAFAFQVLSRAVPTAAAPLSPAEQAWTVDVGEATSPAEDARTPVDAARAPASAYRVRAGDTLWSIAEAAYGSGSEYRRLVAANLGRVMPDGASFSASGVIRPGWVLDVPDPSRWIEAADGQRWYTVEPGDTLSDIAARVLGDAARWPELFELNRDVATLDDGRTLVRPELIWPGLRLRLPSEAHVPVDVEPEPVVLGSATSWALAEEPPPSPPLSVVVPDIEPAIDPALETSAPPPLVRDLHPLPPTDLQASPEPDDELLDVPDAAPASPGLPALALVGLAGAAGLATVGVRRWRLRPLPQEPENEVLVEGGYAEAQLTHDFARQLQGGVTFDLASAYVSHLLRLLDEYNLGDVEPVALRHGRSSTTISLAAKLSEQPILLDLVPIFAERLQAEADAWVSSDQDVQLRLSRVRKTRLLPAAAEVPANREPQWFVPLGVLYDRQVFSAAWPAVGHLLVASLPGRGAETILTSLLATLTAHRSPLELRAWLVARPRTLPAPVDELPHLDATIDPDNPEDLAGLLARLRAELDQRALGGAWPELVIVVPELTSLGERAAELQLLLGAAAASGVRLIAGTSDPIAAMQSPLLSAFTTRMVLHMAAEEASVALLGTADAAFLGGGGRLLLRLDVREPVELYGYQVASDHLERLVRVMRSAYLAPPVFAATPEPPSPQPPPETDDLDGDTEPAQSAEETSNPEASTRSSLAPVESSNMPVQVFCFGAPRVLYAGRQVWPKASVGEIKPWEMLLFIACQPPEGVAREQLAQAIWPDDPGDDELLIHRVRQLRYRLRSRFGAVVGGTVSDGICLERFGPPYLDQTIAHSDAQEFLEVTQQARTQPGPDSIPLLERARALYTGDLLFGPDTRRYAWADERDASGVTLREHYRRRLQQATVTLAELYAQLGRIDDAVELYREVSDADPGDDRAWRALFQLHAGRGDLPSLMREERRLRAALRDLAVRAGERAQSAATEPSVELQREYQRLLATIEGPRRAASAG